MPKGLFGEAEVVRRWFLPGESRTGLPLSAAAAGSVPYGTEIGIGEPSSGRLRDCIVCAG